VQSRPLGSTGLRLTQAGFGTAGIAGLYRECPEEVAMATLAAAWEAGIRYFDTAPFYGAGLAEQRLGRFLADRKRSDVVVSTKVGRLLRETTPAAAPDYGFVGAPPLEVHYDYSRDGILRSLEASLARSGLDRFDLLLIHDIGGRTHGADPRPMAELTGSGIAALEALKRQGVIAGWGMGVNEIEVCLELARIAEPDVILLAGRYTLLDRTAEAELLPLCRKRGIALVIGGVLNSGILATGPIPGSTFDYAPAPAAIMARVERMAEIAGDDLLVAALQFPLTEPAVASVLVGASDPKSVERSVEALFRPIEAKLYDRLSAHALR
jgi:D-threo-aldose 1-dehydrogenase